MTLSDALIYFGCLLLLVGSVFVLLAAIGVLRFPDTLSRMHAASKAGVVGGGLVLLAVGLLSFDAAVMIRALIGIGFLLLTTPLAAHLLARAAYKDPPGIGQLRLGKSIADHQSDRSM